MYAQAWGQLHKLADDWDASIRGIYDIQVVFYLMQLCDKWAEEKAGTYDFYNAGYYFSKINKQSSEKLFSALRDMDFERARGKYPVHVKELAAYLAMNVEKVRRSYEMDWSETYNLMWSNLLYEKSLVADELTRLRLIASDEEKEDEARGTAVLALAHFDIMAGDDETAWERVMTRFETVEASDWFGYMQTFVQVQQWDRLVNWLRWLQHHMEMYNAYDMNHYFYFWTTASMHLAIEEEHKHALAALLPGSYRQYSRFLMDRMEYKAWADLCLLLNLSPLDIDSEELKRVEKEDVRMLLPIYHYAVEVYILGKNRDSYKQAVKLLKNWRMPIKN
ncbi:hypothetical protein FU659_24405 [Paenibacillus sp. N3.4]|nr:hypothetical protein FU659_24405 [Paenibacillus sp. N3.4]